ncbi:sensor domain-containing protein [Mycolicibacterium sp. XJ870]
MIPKVLVLGCLVTLSALACQSHAEPARGNTVDLLSLSLDEVKQISGFDKFTRDVDTREPAADDYAPAGPCQSLSDDLVAFGDSWTEFRAIADSGNVDANGRAPSTSRVTRDANTPLTVPLMAAAIQKIAVYSNDAAAREVFDRRVTAMAECAELNIPIYSGTLSQPDPTVAVYNSGGNVFVFAVKSTVVIDVSVVALPDAERIASDISRAIIERIN